jgi:hypothetical protein
MNNIYLGITLYSSSKELNHLWVFDLNKEIVYFGINPIKEKTRRIIKTESNREWDFFIPINNKNTLNKILSSNYKILNQKPIKQILKEFNLEEYLI